MTDNELIAQFMGYEPSPTDQLLGDILELMEENRSVFKGYFDVDLIIKKLKENGK